MKSLVVGCGGIALVIMLVLLLALGACAYTGTIQDSNRFSILGGATMARLLTENLSEPLNGATTAKMDIHTASGNLTIDGLTGNEPVLASGTLQCLENQGRPNRSVNSNNGESTLTLRGGSAGRPPFRLPWATCNGAFEWQLHLNSKVSSDIIAQTGGGNIKLNLAGMVLKHVSADAGGGNLDVVLPDNAADLDVIAKTGAGKVTLEVGSGITGSNTVNAHSGAGSVVVRVPSGIAAKVHATSGMGKVVVDSRYGKLDGSTYQSPDYDGAANKVEITVQSGAGNVSVTSK